MCWAVTWISTKKEISRNGVYIIAFFEHILKRSGSVARWTGFIFSKILWGVMGERWPSNSLTLTSSLAPAIGPTAGWPRRGLWRP